MKLFFLIIYLVFSSMEKTFGSKVFDIKVNTEYSNMQLFDVTSSNSTLCIEDPTKAVCKNLNLMDDIIPNALENLCKSTVMPACSLSKTCIHQPKIKDLEVCSGKSIVSHICKYDMPGMKGCRDINNVCSNSNSVVEECANYNENAPKYLPTTKEIKVAAAELCSSMEMEECKCMSDVNKSGSTACNYFDIYMKGCSSMPEMEECRGIYDNVCKNIKDIHYCSDGNDYNHISPSMKMYFHAGIHEYFLFKSYVPQNRNQYIFGLIIIFLLCIIYESLPTIGKSIEKRIVINWEGDINLPGSWNATVEGIGYGISDTSASGILRGSEGFIENLINRVVFYSKLGWKYLVYRLTKINRKEIALRSVQGSLRAMSLLIGYSLMLLAMTFNVGIFLTIVFGVGFGRALFPTPFSAGQYTDCCD